MKKNHLILLVGAPLFAIVLVIIRVYFAMCVWTYDGPDIAFDILPGDNFAQINSHLIQKKIISSGRLFHRYSQYKGVLNKFKTGRYIIRKNSNLLDVYNIFINEKSLAFLFTIPEGKNMYEIGHMLEEKNIASYKEFIELAKNRAFLKQEGINSDTAEGYLYPETYDLFPGIPAKAIMKMMLQQFHKKNAHIDYSKSKLTPREVLILASVVEKETGDKNERPMIAGVFHNRLKIKMRLQSDPTTIYGIFEDYKGNITRKDLLTPTEYNTYTIPALPIGPISNPGVAAIQAVLTPAVHNYLYFVSQNNGTHIFSENYENHVKAVNNWQKNSKNREGRSWRDHQDKKD